ncbi:MAG: PIG-L family deacetylase [Chloroflexota bacterium]|nr:PIG-L family deacetylase [Chloroflexota bacterium]
MADEQEYQPRSVLVVVAHPDDAEFMAAGTLAKWAREGKDVNYVVCTAGDKGTSDPNMSPAALAEIRRREQRAACDRIGANELVFLGYEDGVLQNTLQLRRDVVRMIRRFRPDVVVCQDPTSRWSAQGYLNHADHRAAGDATLDAVYPSARDPHVFPDLLKEGLQPHKVREVYVGGTNTPDVWIDIADTIDAKIAALRAHESQVGPEVRPNRDLDAFIRERAAIVGAPQGLQYAEAFKYFMLR